MGFSFWQKWLIVVGVLVVVFGLALAFFNQTPFFDFAFNNRINPVFWGGSFLDVQGRAFQQWAYAVLGATTASWGVFLTFVSIYPFSRKEAWAWNCIAAAVGLWYLVDTFLSLSAGVIYNALFNTLLLILVLLPLAFTYPYLFGKRK